jgi:hypothetical protein
VPAEDGELTIERSRFRAGTGRHAIFAEFMAIDATDLVVTGNRAARRSNRCVAVHVRGLEG